MPVGLSGPHPGPRIHPVDRSRPLQRRVHGQLGVERLPRNPRPHLRSPLRARLPARPGRGQTSKAEPVAICRLKRVAADFKDDIRARLPKPAAQNGKRIACVGAGPASLTVARDLAPLGYDVTVFDQDPQAGGMIRTQIPRFRLPEEVIDEEVGYVLDLGVEFRGGVRIDR